MIEDEEKTTKEKVDDYLKYVMEKNGMKYAEPLERYGTYKPYCDGFKDAIKILKSCKELTKDLLETEWIE